MFRFTCAAGALLLCAALPAAACDKAAGTPVIQLKVFAPLSAQSGPATDVSIDAAGCVTSRFSEIDKRHGVHRVQLGGAEFAQLKREIQAARLAEFDAASVKAWPPLAPGQTGWIVSDPDIVELTLAPGYADAKSARGKSIRFVDIDGALMNRPEVAALQSLGAVKARLGQLAQDKRLQRESDR